MSPTPSTTPTLATGHLHEIHAGLEDWAAAIGFALSGLGAKTGLPLVLLRAPRGPARSLHLHGDGLLALGIDPARLFIVETRAEQDMLRAGLDAARSPHLAGIVMETWGALSCYDLTASRRLVLAGEHSGAGMVVLRGDTAPRSSAAHTRWAIRAIPSAPLPARAPGMPAIEVELLRQRGGPAGMRWRLEWDKEHGIFQQTQSILQPDIAPPSGAVVPFPALRTG